MKNQPEVIEYVRDRYLEEQERFNHIETKAERILGLVTFSLTALGALVAFADIKLRLPCSLKEWIKFAPLASATLCLLAAWMHALDALKIKDCPVAPKSKITLDYLRNENEEAAIDHILNCYADTIEKLGKVIADKVGILEKAYEELSFAVGLLVLFVVLIFFI